MATRPIEGKIVLTADTDNAVRGAEAVKQAYQQAGTSATAASQQAAGAQGAATAATERAAQAADHLGTEHQQAGAAAAAAGEAAAAAAQRQAQSTQQATAAASGLTSSQERFLQQLRESAELYGKSTAEVLRYRAAQMGVGKEAEASIAALERHGKAGQVSAGQTAMAWQQLPLQMQDVAVSIAGGMNPLMVFMQQAPQIVGSFGGLKNTVAALATVFTPLRMLIGGATAALGVMAVAALQGHQESSVLTKSIELTGGAAGVTKGQILAMGTEIADSQGVAVGAVRDTLQALLDSGTFVGSTLDSAGRAATALSKLTGASADEVAKDFSQMKSGVASWAVEHNKSYNFITADQVAHIRNLEAQGRGQEAMRVALDALAKTMEERSAPALGLLEKGWMAVGTAISKAWDAAKNFGREPSTEDRLNTLRKQLAAMEEAKRNPKKGLLGDTIGVDEDELAALRQQVSEAEAKLAEERRVAQERADKAAAEQRKINQAAKPYQDVVTQGKLASDQKDLAQSLKHQQDLANAVEQAHKRGEISEQEHASRLNKIDQDRLRLQLDNLRRRKTAEENRVAEKPEDVLAKAAAVKQIDAQIIAMQAQLAKTVSDGEGIVSASALATGRDRAQQWAAAWKTASDQVRSYAEINAGTRAARSSDPVQRAEVDAAVRTAAPRRQLADQQRELQKSIDLIPDKERLESRLAEIGGERRDLQMQIGVLPKADKDGKAALQEQLDALKREQADIEVRVSLVPSDAAGSRSELQRQLAELTAQGEQHIAELTRAGQLDSVKAQYQELTTALSQAEADIERLVTAGTISTTEAERRKFAERAKALPQLQALAAAQRELAQTAGERTDANGAVQAVQALADQKTEIEKSIRSSASNEFGKFFNSITNGSKTAGQALRDMVGGFAQSMLDLISKRLGDKMLSSVLDAIDTKGAGGGGAGGSLISTAASWIGSFFHDGGVVGAGGARTASFPAAMWSVAPRYHTGGIAGLKPNEVPAILMGGPNAEEVLTADDPRHVRNGGLSATRSLGPVSISISVTGAEGNAPDQAAAAQDLGGMMEQAVNAWATKQSRPGGVLWKGK